MCAKIIIMVVWLFQKTLMRYWRTSYLLHYRSGAPTKKISDGWEFVRFNSVLFLCQGRILLFPLDNGYKISVMQRSSAKAVVDPK